MRPLTKFALHALTATMLTALAATGAAAADRPNTYLALGDSIPAASGPAASGTDRREHIEILSYSFGNSSAVKLDPVYIKSWSTSGGADAPPPPRAGGSNQITMDDMAGKERLSRLPGKRPPPTVTLKRGKNQATDGDPDRPIIAGHVPNAVGANETLTVGGGRTEARLPAGTRLTVRVTKPLARGSVWVRVSTPWAGCRVGARYPSLELGGAERYVLEDVTVASCGGASAADDRPTEEVAFYYNKIAFNYASSPAKVQVRGWDPKKKEE